MNHKSFTLIELVMMVGVLAALALAAVTRFDLSEKDVDSVAKQLRSNLQLAQDLAMTHGSVYGFRSINVTSYEIFDSAPGTPTINPLTRGDFVVDITPVEFVGVVPTVLFARTGMPDIVADTAIALSGGAQSRTVTVIKNTGFVTIGP